MARPEGAVFSRLGTELLPPGRSIVFNRNLTHPDGLLEGMVMRDRKVGFSEASKIVSTFVDQCRTNLGQHRRQELEGLGLLFLSQNQNILFESNSGILNVSGFGLASVSIVPLTKQNGIEIEKKEETLVLNRAAKKVVVFADRDLTARRTPLKIRNLRMGAAVSAILLIVALWLIFLGKEGNRSNFLASLNFWSKHSGTGKAMRAGRSLEMAPLQFTAPSPLESNEAGFLSSEKSGNMGASETIAKLDSEKAFQVVVGCFKIKENANRMVHIMKAKGRKAGIVGQNGQGLFIVSAAGFGMEVEARNTLEDVRKIVPSAWVMVR